MSCFTTIRLSHQSRRIVNKYKVFDDIKGTTADEQYSSMVAAIQEYGNTRSAEVLQELGASYSKDNYDPVTGRDSDGNKDPVKQAYNNAVGEAFEVYNEFFFRVNDGNAFYGVKDLRDTSDNAFQAGYDFTFTRVSDNGQGLMQSKFRSDPTYQFDTSALSTFFTKVLINRTPQHAAILFTNLEDVITDKKDGVFHFTLQGIRNAVHVIDRNAQVEFLKLYPQFFQHLRDSLIISSQGTQLKKLYALREHQQEMHDAALTVLNAPEGKGRIIAATGAGKTLCQYYSIDVGFSKGYKLQVLVAPTIALLEQHFRYFEQFGMFHSGGVRVIHFRSGGEPDVDDEVESYRTTRGDEIKPLLEEDRKTLIFTTYVSQENLFNLFRKMSDDKKQIEADLVIWDEFHHTVKQNENNGAANMAHMKSIPTKRSLFYSASEKRGRIMDSNNKEIYGPRLCNIPYSRLRDAGIVVPKIVIKVIMIDETSKKTKSLKAALKKAARDENINLDNAVTEAGAMIVARTDLINMGKIVNMVTFSRAVSNCKVIAESQGTKEWLDDCLVQTVYSGVKPEERKRIFEAVTQSRDSILCQHSIVKEGIDVTPFNSLLLSRGLEVIGMQQAIGRIVRCEPEDTAKLKANEIKLDSPYGWKKYCSYVYVVMDDIKQADVVSEIEKLIIKLMGAGLDVDDFQFDDLVEPRSGIEIQDDPRLIKIKGESKTDYLNQAKETVYEMAERMKVEIFETAVLSETAAAADELIKDSGEEEYVLGI